jgi:hypothetical protein
VAISVLYHSGKHLCASFGSMLFGVVNLLLKIHFASRRRAPETPKNILPKLATILSTKIRISSALEQKNNVE